MISVGVARMGCANAFAFPPQKQLFLKIFEKN